MPDHHSSCPLEPLDCPFKDAGCTEKITRKDMEDHMTANQQKHMLLTFQSLEEMKLSLNREIEDLEENIRDDTSIPESVTQSLSRMKSILKPSLHYIEDTVRFYVTDFSELRKEKKVWRSPPFSIGGRIRVSLAVHPMGIGKGQGSHVSVSLLLVDDIVEEMPLQYDVSVAALNKYYGEETFVIMGLCTSRPEDNAGCHECSDYFPFPSPAAGEVLQSEEQFMEEEAESTLINDSLLLEIELQEHEHEYTSDPDVSDAATDAD